jgi:hypothetical protein
LMLQWRTGRTKRSRLTGRISRMRASTARSAARVHGELAFFEVGEAGAKDHKRALVQGNVVFPKCGCLALPGRSYACYAQHQRIPPVRASGSRNGCRIPKGGQVL